MIGSLNQRKGEKRHGQNQNLDLFQDQGDSYDNLQCNSDMPIKIHYSFYPK